MNSKGFTLVELLAAISVFAVIGLIAVVSVFGVKDKFNTSYYKAITNSLSLAAKDYSIDHRGNIPKDGVKIDITTFIQKGYISPVKGKNKEDCSGYVIVKKRGMTYDTKVCLICDDYKSDDCE